MVAELKRLDPKPGCAFDAPPALTLVPDVLTRRGPADDWIVVSNLETLPRVLINRGFHARAVVGAKSRDEKAWVAERFQTASWLVKSLEQRANTILKVSAEIIRRQGTALPPWRSTSAPADPARRGGGGGDARKHRIPRHLQQGDRDAARHLRTEVFTTAIAGTMGGESVSAEAVRHRIKAMVEAEQPADILSDDAIVERLRHRSSGHCPPDRGQIPRCVADTVFGSAKGRRPSRPDPT